MSTLAFNKEGEPFTFDPRTDQLRLRRFRKPGARGTCEAVLDADGEQIYIDADADYTELRQAVDNVPGFYRLDQCDEEGRPIPGLPPAYVSIEAARHAGSSSNADAMAVVRELAAINAEVSKTMADRFAAVMQSTAEILRAADGAGIAHRKPLVVRAAVTDDDDDDDDGEDIEEGEQPEVPPVNPMISALTSISTIVQAVQPMVAELKRMYQDMKATVAQGTAQTTPPAAPTASGSEPTPAPPTEAAPSSGPVQGGGAAGVSGADIASTNAHVGTARLTPPPSPKTAVTASTAEKPTTSGSVITAPATTAKPTVGGSVTTAPATASSAPTASGSATNAPATASSASTANSTTNTGNAGAVALATAAASQATSPNTRVRPTDSVRPEAMTDRPAVPTAAPPTGVRNAPLAPTTQQIAHLTAIYARLTPNEQAIAQQVIARMSHDVRARWLVDLSAQSVDQAVRKIRDTIASLQLAQRDRDRG